MNKYKKIKFKHFATVNPGQSPKSEFYSNNEGIPFLQGNRTFGLLYPTIDTYTKKTTKIAYPGDILMSVRAPVGDLNFADKEVCIGRGVAGIKAKDGNNKFLFYCLKYNIQNLIRQGGGTTYDSVNKDVINDFELIMPSQLTDRTQIAKVLSDIDAKIELNNKINAELEAMAKLIYDYWFVQFDFPNEEGKPYKSSGGKMVWNEELKREIPEGWEVGNLGDILYQVNNSIEPFEYPNLSYLPIDKLPTKKLTYHEYESRDSANSSLQKFEEDDILLGAMRVYFHRVCNAIEDGISRSTLMVLRPHKKEFKNFALFTINKEECISFATKNSTGTSIPYAKWKNNLEKYQIYYPSTNLLYKEFNSIINPVLDKLKNNSKEIQKLSELRDWLLPMLMNGQVKVK
jgi:type I restriction enzyme S subunit